MPQKNISGKDLNHAITSEDILGKDIIDKTGRIVGVTEKVLIDPHTLEFVGICADKGFFKKGLSIGKDYIKEIKDHAVFLKVAVAYELEGMIVFDKNGKKMGVVSGVELYGTKNKLKCLHVRPNNITALVRKETIIPNDSIASIGDNIVLNCTHQELTQKNTTLKAE